MLNSPRPERQCHRQTAEDHGVAIVIVSLRV